MKILFYRYGSLCEPDAIAGFKGLGLSVDEDTSAITCPEMTTAERISAISPKITDGGYSFVFSINFFPWISEVCKIVNLVYMSLIVSSPIMDLYSKSISNSVNRIFLFDRDMVREFESYNPGHVFHTPLAADPDRTDRLFAARDEGTHQKFSSDISFVGSTYQEKCPFNRAVLPDYERGFIDGLIEAQLKIYGYNFIEEVLTDEMAETFLKCTPGSYRFQEGYREDYKAAAAQLYIDVKISEQERLRTFKLLSDNFNMDIYTNSDTSSLPNIHNRGPADSRLEMPLIFHNSKININITAKSIRSGLPLRIFDVLGCGGFLITNYQAELGEFFEIGRDLVAYESTKHLLELCSYYLTHSDEREEIAFSGYQKIKTLYNYRVCLLKMIDAAFPG